MPATRTIVAYVEETLDTFADRPLCAVDSLVLSCLSYLRLPECAAFEPARSWDGMRLADIFRAEHFDALFAGMWDLPNSRRLLTACAASPRFRDLRVCGYTERFDAAQQKQFAAVSFAGVGLVGEAPASGAPGGSAPEGSAPSSTPPAGNAAASARADIPPAGSAPAGSARPGPFVYLAFRGTDATLVGWKEDFNMAFEYPVPSQEEAAYYADRAAQALPGAIALGGHSKGGNLAVYAAAKCAPDARARVRRAFSHDGPGFMENVLADKDFRAVLPHVEKTLPQSSLVGMLLQNQERYQVVRSARLSVWQHDPFSWEVDGCAFVPIDQLTPDARYVDRTLSAWVAQMSVSERERLIDTLYDVMRSADDAGGAGGMGGATGGTVTSSAPTSGEDNLTVAAWAAQLPKNAPAIARALKETDPQTTDFLLRTVKALVGLAAKNFPDIFRDGFRDGAAQLRDAFGLRAGVSRVASAPSAKLDRSAGPASAVTAESTKPPRN